MNVNEKIILRAEIAKKHFVEGYNCSQSVALAFCDLTELEQTVLLKLSSPFGGGLGRMREVCGAVNGMALIEGLILGYTSPKDMVEKKRVYEQTRSLAEKYSAENGSIICRELLLGVPHTNGAVPEERNIEYYKKRPCADLVYSAAKILAEHLIECGVKGV